MKRVYLLLILFLYGASLLGQKTGFFTRLLGGSGQQKSYTQSISVDLRIITSLPWVLYESSGIVVTHPNKIWSHEDSGNDNILYCVDTLGLVLRSLTITNARNVDWEDLATDNLGRIYINDAGNNNNNRKNLTIYRIPNPETITGSTANAEVINFVFEDQTQFPPPQSNRNFDIEAIVWHNDSIFLFTKNRSTPQNGICKQYKLPAQPGNYTAKLVDSIFLGNLNENARVTAADIYPPTGELVLLTATRILSFSNYPGSRFFDGDITEYQFTSAPGQNEGLAFVTSNRLFMTEEGAGNFAGNMYEIKLPITGTGSGYKADPPISIYPNPSSNLVTIQCNWPDTSNLELFDARGNLLYQTGLKDSIQLNMAPYKPGFYFIKISNGIQAVTRRITKQ